MLRSFHLPTGPISKALTIKQPWAWLIVRGHKRFENRSWTTRHRGRFVVHAGSNRDTVLQLIRSGEYRRLQELYGLPDPDALAYGAAVGTAQLIDDMPLDEDRDRYGPHDFAVGPRCFRLASPFAWAEPAPCKGALGFWAWNFGDVVADRLLPPSS